MGTASGSLPAILAILATCYAEQNPSKQEASAEAAAEAAFDAAEAAAEAELESSYDAARAAGDAANAALGADASAEGAMEAVYQRPTRIVRGEVWEQVANDNTGSRYYIRSSDLSAIDSSRIVWVHGDHSQDATIPARSSMQRMQISCSSRNLQTLGGTFRDPADRVLSNIRGSFTAEYPEPGTIGDRIITSVCGN